MVGLDIKGSILTERESLEIYSRDLSGYAVRPKMVVVPEDEEDVSRIIRYSKANSIPITPRGAGSNQSGSAVGSGIIVLFNRMNRVVAKRGKRVRVQPGIVYGTLDAEMRMEDLRIPYDPTSRAFCTIGGNVATKASGIRSLKYGTVDESLINLRFFDTKHGLVDTSAGLPTRLYDAIAGLRNRIREDEEAKVVFKHRGNLKSSSGYNIKAFYQHDDPEEIVTHLLAGSIGTLGVFTEIDLELIHVPSSRMLYLLYFDTLVEAAEVVQEILNFGPSAIEILDDHGLSIFRAEHSLDVPDNSKAVLMVEFDQGLEQAESIVTNYAEEKGVRLDKEADHQVQEKLWNVRENMLTWIKKEIEKPDEKFPPFADDLCVPPDRLADFIRSLERIFINEGTEAIIYGHAGEGNIDVRPMIRTLHWQETLRRLAGLVFRTALKYSGTISGEHGSGRNRSMYLRDEWGERVYRYFEEIKALFDPEGLLNPGVMFTTADLTQNLLF
jgi:FAD/FMN-containing dehydrogenase